MKFQSPATTASPAVSSPETGASIPLTSPRLAEAASPATNRPQVSPALPTVGRTLPKLNTYWVRPGLLMAGEYPGYPDDDVARERLRAYLKAGVTFFLDLTELFELPPYWNLLKSEAKKLGMEVRHQRLAIRDASVPKSRRHMKRILDTIDEALAREETVYVHCWGGVGRTGIVVGCYLVRHGFEGEKALEKLASLWQNVGRIARNPVTPETQAQRDWVRQWKE